MKLLQTLFACCVLALATTSMTAQEAKSSGDKLPSVQVKNIDGKILNIKDAVKEGQITVISFWATWCSPCKKELDNMMDLYEDWKKDYNVHIIAVSIDDPRTAPKVKSTVDAKSWEYTVLLDSNEDLKKALNINTVPFTIMLNQAGEIIYQHSGYKEGDELHLEEKIKEIAKK